MKTNNITQMTAAKHKFEGFAVRMSRNHHHFRIYISASSKVVGWATLAARRKIAFDTAKQYRKLLLEVIDNPRSWRKGKLTKATADKLTNIGINIDVPALETA